DGVPNHRPEGTTVDNHHFVTGSGTDGKLYHSGSTCDDWTSVTASGKPRFGYSWPRGSRGHWISGMSVGGCKAGIQITEQNDVNNPIIGAAGGYGGFYCFALNP
ncbi:MAG: hypothetical protein JW913_06380, partial [Chitinispirillaceae bacterium]|nr:hypothetical protein [Chitinispirillaceae bacterium]